jgi:pantoate--beta-alanine ligase
VRVITTTSQFSAALEAERALGRRVGLVPTMGALHAGHRSLMERAGGECDVVAVTVFVNPLQFNAADDLARYPRDLAGDVTLAARAGAALVFAPSVEEMYPDFPAPPVTAVRVEGLGGILEGASRPGHFDGVATVVTKLFALAGRCRAYFGEKDFQQLAVVRRLVDDLSLPVEVVGCPTVREGDGLALSSRNVRLSDGERRAAAALPRALQAGRGAVVAGERDPGRVVAVMGAVLGRQVGVVPDYAVAVDADTLAVPARLRGEVRLLVAATVGSVRLIDNVGVTVDESVSGSRGTSTGVRGAAVVAGTGEER